MKEGLSFVWDLSLENSADSYLCFWLVFLHSVSYLFFLYWSPSSSLSTFFDSTSFNIDEVVCFCHVTYVFQSESTLYSCLNVKKLLAQSRCKIWSLSDCNWTQTQNHLVHKQTLNHLAKLACVWLSVCLQTKWFWVRVRLQSLTDEVLSINPSAVCLCRL